jgi:hypothetical protein
MRKMSILLIVLTLFVFSSIFSMSVFAVSSGDTCSSSGSYTCGDDGYTQLYCNADTLLWQFSQSCSTTDSTCSGGSCVALCGDGVCGIYETAASCPGYSDCAASSENEVSGGCGDVIDNDDDGATDCADSDCTGDSNCVPTCVAGASIGSMCNCGNIPYSNGYCCSDSTWQSSMSSCSGSNTTAGTCSSIGGSCCSSSDICSGSVYYDKSDCSNCCVGTCSSTNTSTVGCSSSQPWSCYTQTECDSIIGTWCTDIYGGGYCQSGSCPLTGCVSGNVWSCYTEDECTGVGGYWTGGTSKWCSDIQQECSASNYWNCYTAETCEGVGGYFCGSYCQNTVCPECTSSDKWNCYSDIACTDVSGNWCSDVCPTCNPYCSDSSCPVCTESNAWSCYSESACSGVSGFWCEGTYGGSDWCQNSECPTYECSNSEAYNCKLKADCDDVGASWCTPERGGVGWCQNYDCPTYECSSSETWNCRLESECVGAGAKWCGSYCSDQCPTCSDSQVWNCNNKDDCKNSGGDWCGTYCSDYTCPTCDSSNTWNCYTLDNCLGAGGYWCKSSGSYASNEYCQSTICPTCSKDDAYSCYTESECTGVGNSWCTSGTGTSMYSAAGWCKIGDCPTCSENDMYNCYSESECTGVGGNWCGNYCSPSICPSCSSTQPWNCYDKDDCNSIGLGSWCGGATSGYCDMYECPSCTESNVWNCYSEVDCKSANGKWCDTWCTESRMTCPVMATKETVVKAEIPEGCYEETDSTGIVKVVCEKKKCPEIIPGREEKCVDHGGVPERYVGKNGCEKFMCNFFTEMEETNPWENHGECPTVEENELIVSMCEESGSEVIYYPEGGCEFVHCSEKEVGKCTPIEGLNINVVEDIEIKCKSIGKDVVEGYDVSRGCEILMCADEETYCKSLPTAAYSNCDGEMVVEEDENGCVVFAECVEPSDDIIGLSPSEKLKELPDDAVLLDIAFGAEELKMAFIDLGDQSSVIANSWENHEDEHNEKRFRRAANMFYTGADKVDEIKNKLRERLATLTIDDMEEIKIDIRKLWKGTLKDALYLMLSNAEEDGVCVDDECFNDAFSTCREVVFEPEDGVVAKITGLEGDLCVIEVEQGGDSMNCKVPDYAEGLENPEEQLLPFCEGSLADQIKSSVGGE